MLNAAVKPPEIFGTVPKLTSAEKLQQALKTFPTRSSQKFTGSPGSVNVIEFLNSLNTE